MNVLLIGRPQQIWAALALALLVMCSSARATETLTFIHTDIAGSPWAATDSSGKLVWREAYRPYGERTKNRPAAETNRNFFHGKAFDSETGLTYFGARYYDAAVGRFMGVDPQGFDEKNLHSFNRYAYGNNNPYRYRDSDGRTWSLILAAAIPVGIGAIIIATRPPEERRAIARAVQRAIGGMFNENPNETGPAPAAGPADHTNDGTTGSPDNTGCVYCVKGEKTSSGQDYIGSTDNLGQRKRDKSDGRDREGAQVIDTYPRGDRDARRTQEQQAINDRGGVDKLDNRRNEIAPSKWPNYGVRPPD